MDERPVGYLKQFLPGNALVILCAEQVGGESTSAVRYQRLLQSLLSKKVAHVMQPDQFEHHVGGSVVAAQDHRFQSRALRDHPGKMRRIKDRTAERPNSGINSRSEE